MALLSSLKRSLIFLLTTSLASAIHLTPPTGKYSVGASKHVIPFYNPHDPFAPSHTETSFLATIYYPTHDKPCAPVEVLEPELAKLLEEGWGWEEDTLANLTADIIWNASMIENKHGKGHEMPTIIFGPGGGGPPTSCYTILITELVSQGYTVAALDHVYEQPFLRYPNGTGVYGLPLDYNFTEASVGKVYDLRLNDTLAFIDLWPSLVDQHSLPSSKTKIAALGHSLGGAVSFGALLASPKILTALNIDGSNFGVPASNTSAASTHGRPVMQLGSEGHLPSADPTWEVFTAQQGERTWWETALADGVGHLDYTDAGFWKRLPNNETMGDIGSDRVVELMREWTKAFLGFAVLGEEKGILKGDSKEWPEVDVVEASFL